MNSSRREWLSVVYHTQQRWEQIESESFCPLVISESEREGKGGRVFRQEGGSEMVLTFTLFTWPALLILPQFCDQGRYSSGFVASIVWSGPIRAAYVRPSHGARPFLFLDGGGRDFFSSPGRDVIRGFRVRLSNPPNNVFYAFCSFLIKIWYYDFF